MVPTATGARRGVAGETTPIRRAHRTSRACRLAVALASVFAALAVAGVPGAGASVLRGDAASTPIEHVVVILQENHSFDNVLGQLCIQDHRECSAASSGKNEKRGNDPPDPRERRRRQPAPRPECATGRDGRRQDGRLGNADGVQGQEGASVLHAVRPHTDSGSRRAGARGSDLGCVLLARHRPVLGRAPGLLRPDPRRLRGKQSAARHRRAR